MNNLRKLIKEELTKTDVKSEISNKIKSKEMEEIIKKVVLDLIKSNKEIENKVLEITKNSLVQFYKTMWTRRNFWKSSITNKPS